MRVDFTPDAEADVSEWAEKLESSRRGYGHKFLADYRTAIENIERFPRMYSETEDGLPGVETRNAILAKFALRVIYVIRDTDVVVLAVRHARQEPGTWHSRWVHVS